MAARAPADDASDADLVRRAAAGERAAFAALYSRYQGAVYRFARMMSGSSALADDVTQETFLALMGDLRRYEPQRAGLTTYLYGIARNLTRNRLRRERRFVRLEAATGAREPAAETDPGMALAEARDLARLRAVIAGLPSRYREAIILCHLHDLSYAEVAGILQVPIGTVRSRLSRGRQLIAHRMEPQARVDGRPLPDAPARCVV